MVSETRSIRIRDLEFAREQDILMQEKMEKFEELVNKTIFEEEDSIVGEKFKIRMDVYKCVIAANMTRECTAT